MPLGMAPAPPKTGGFYADSPFLLLLVEKHTGSLLFAGSLRSRAIRGSSRALWLEPGESPFPCGRTLRLKLAILLGDAEGRSILRAQVRESLGGLILLWRAGWCAVKNADALEDQDPDR